MPETRPKRLTYWRAESMQGRVTLQEALTDALRRRARVGERIQQAPGGEEGGQVSIFVNQTSPTRGMLFGQLVLYEAGRHHQAIAVNEDQPALNLLAIAPPAEGGARTEFLESVMYFGLLGDHAVLLQSRPLRGREFESHLSWLLAESGAIQQDDGMSLTRGLAADARHAMAQDPPTKLTIGTPLFENLQHVRPEGGRREFWKPRGPAWEFLRKLTEQSLDDLRLDNSIDPESINVKVEVSFRRRTDEEGAKVMKQLTQSLRHLHEDDVKVHLPKTGELRGDRIFLNVTKNILARNGIVDGPDLYSHMQQWLAGLIERRIVEAE